MSDNSEVVKVNERTSEHVTLQTAADRRKLFRRLVSLGAVAGIGALLGGSGNKPLLPPVQACTGATCAVANVDNDAAVGGINASTNGGIGVKGTTDQASTSTTTIGVFGLSKSLIGWGVLGQADYDGSNGSPIGVRGETYAPNGYGVEGVAGFNGAAGGIGVLGSAMNPNTTPIVAYGNLNGGQIADLQQWLTRNPTFVRARVDKNGSILTTGALGFDSVSNLVPAGVCISAPAGQSMGLFTSSTERVRIDSSGNVGIGTTSPARSLHLVGHNANFRMDRDIDTAAFILVRTAVGNFNTIWKTFYVGVNASGVNNGSFFIGDNGTNVAGTSTTRLIIDNTGRVGLGRTPTANNLEVEGTASKTAAGSWLANSDMRIKTDIEDIDDALATIRKLHPVRFRYTGSYKAKHPSIKNHPYYNFIAQEYREVFPDSVQDDGEGLLQMDSYNTTPYLVKAVQELSERSLREIEQLRIENKELNEQNRRLSERLEAVERKLTAAV